MAEEYGGARTGTSGVAGFLIRLLVGAVVLAITAFLTPGFSINGIWPLIIGAIVLAVLDYAASKVLGVNATPFGRGITGFLMAAVIIYLTQFITDMIVPGFNVSIWGAIIGAFIYGIVDAIIPGRAM